MASKYDLNKASQEYENKIFIWDAHDGGQPINCGNSRTLKGCQNKGSNVPSDWDIFPQHSHHWNWNDSDNFWKTTTKLMTILFIVFLFTTVLATGLLSRITLHILIWHLYSPSSVNVTGTKVINTTDGELHYNTATTSTALKAVDKKWILSVFLVIIAPYILSILSCLKTICLRRTRSIHFGSLLVILFIESLHSIALTCLVFIVLPAFIPPSASVIYLAVTCLLPILDLYQNDCSELNKRGVFRKSMIVFGMLLQWGAIVLTCFYIFRNSVDKNNTMLCIVFVVSTITLSVKYWENFSGVSDTSCNMKYIKWIHQTRRTKTMLLTNIFKTIISFVSIIVIYGTQGNSFIEVVKSIFSFNDTKQIHDFGSLDFDSADICYTYEPYVIAIINICSSYACAKAAKTACVIGCQIVCFSIPLLVVPLVTPFALTMLFYDTSVLSFANCGLIFSDLNLKSLQFSGVWQIVTSGIMFYVSFLIITWYIWRTNGYKLGKMQRMFITPSYCGIHTELSLLLNRKQRDEECDEIIEMMRAKAQYEPEQSNSGALPHQTIPMIYACATMWHETEKEMTQLLKSVFRMDKHQHALQTARKCVQPTKNTVDYDFEAHVFFDDAFDSGKGGSNFSDINDYVKTLIDVIDKAASDIHQTPVELGQYESMKTPYGGRLKWTMLGGNALVVHLKDKSKIRHRKRWSQVMYMYYLLGYNLNENENDISKVINKACNTYLLTLDGDVDFKPEAVMHLVRRMTKNSSVGAACGRIHPIGSGPMVWYQKFEYAISHWLQKATEHVTGCVLCSPGCFSLYRGSALVGVLKTYSMKATSAKQFIQYDQGEDRWLCTLLLKYGYRVEYCAESDSYTFAPEGFYEYFNQRRRWSPSTMSNILDLLINWREVVKENNCISRLFMLYQLCFFISLMLTPGTIFLMIVGAIITAFPSIPVWLILTLNILPVGLFTLSCFCVKTDKQLFFAGTLSAMYSITMILVLVGILTVAANDGFCSTITIFLMFLIGILVLSALLHPQEASNIIHCIIYLLCIPSMSMLLMLYSIGNLHVVSWGTREDNMLSTNNYEKEQTSITDDVIRMFFRNQSKDNSLFQHVLQRLDEIEDATQRKTIVQRPLEDISHIECEQTYEEDVITPSENYLDITGDKLYQNTSFTVDLQSADSLSNEEESFWEKLIEKHLKPMDRDEAKEKQIQYDLIALRNKCCLVFFLLNTFLVTLVCTLTQNSDYAGALNIHVSCSGNVFTIEPISITFTVVFGILLVVQFLCLLLHRTSTLIHIVASTQINNNREVYSDFITSLKILQRQGSSSVLESKPLGHTDDLDFAFSNGKGRKMKTIVETMRETRPKSLDDIVRKNLDRIKFDIVEGSSGFSEDVWCQRFKDLNIRTDEEKTALRNAYPKLRALYPNSSH